MSSEARDGSARAIRAGALGRVGGALLWTAPTAFAVYAPLALLAANIGHIPPEVALRSVAFSLTLGIAVTAAVALLVRSKESAIVLASGAVLAFFSYGHIYDSLRGWDPAAAIARHRFLVPLA